MSNELEPLVLKITGSANGLSAAIGRAEADLKRFTAQARAQQSEIASMPSLTSLLVGGGAGAATLGAFKLASQAEQASVAFEVLTGSVTESANMLKELRDLGASTPLNFAGLQENAKVMLGFGIAAGDVLPNLRALGDISGGNTEKMKLLTLAFSQSAAAGRLMGQDVLQMINAGFNPLQEISKNTGRTMVQLKADMEAGAISFEMVRQAFMSATSEGGRFNNMLERQAATLAGVTGIAVDKIQQLGASIAAVFVPAVKSAVTQLTYLIDALSQVNSQNVQTATTIGTGVTAFASVMAIAPKVVSAFKWVGTAIAGAASGPPGWVTLIASLAAAAGAAHLTERSFQQYESAAASLVEKQKEVAETSSQATKEIEAFTAAYLAQSDALNKSIAEGIKTDKVAEVTRSVNTLTKQLNEARQQAHELEQALAIRDRLKDAYSNKRSASDSVDDAASRLAAMQPLQRAGMNVGPQVEALKKELDSKMQLYRKATEELAKVSRDSDGFKAGSEEGFAKATGRVAELQKEIDGLNGALSKNKEYWESQAAAIRKSFESPVDVAKSQMASLSEAVKQGGLEMEVYVQAAAKIKGEFNAAAEAKKELAKPVQFAGAVTRGSAADIQDRFRYMTSPANQQQTKLQEEGNRLLNSMDESMKKISAKLFSNPVANIA